MFLVQVAIGGGEAERIGIWRKVSHARSPSRGAASCGSLTEHYAGKILRVRAGARLSVQYHREKDETSYVLSGRVLLSQGDSAEEMTDRTLGPGDSWRSRPSVVHTLEAIEDAEIIEVSTPQLDDVVRLEDRYGRTLDAGSAADLEGADRT